MLWNDYTFVVGLLIATELLGIAIAFAILHTILINLKMAVESPRRSEVAFVPTKQCKQPTIKCDAPEICDCPDCTGIYDVPDIV